MNLLPYFAAGLAASVHCVGMCGGIAGALGGAAGPAGRAAPVTFRPRKGAAAVAQPAASALAPAAVSSPGRPTINTLAQPTVNTLTQPALSSLAQPAVGALAQFAVGAPAQPAMGALAQSVVGVPAQPAVGALARPAADVLAPHPAAALAAALPRVLRIATFNTGRIASYMLAGAVAGGLAGGAAGLAEIEPLQRTTLLLANLMLLAMGLYLMDAWRGLAHVERAGAWLWRGLQPMLRTVLPITTPARALAAGALWGWLPCGLVYSMLVTAMLSGSAINGAAIMLAFGLGNTPLLFATGMSGMALRGFLQRRNVRIACGVLVMGFAVLGLLRVAGMAIPGVPALHGWTELMCIGGAR